MASFQDIIQYPTKPELSERIRLGYFPLTVLDHNHQMVEFHLKQCCKKYKKGKRCKKCPHHRFSVMFSVE